MTAIYKGNECFDLTVDQQKAANAFCNWLEKNNENIPFVLSGYAGSGKTYLSIKLLKIVESKGFCWTVAAPTHKAVGVLRNVLDEQELRPTWYPSTIHRLLRLKLKRKGNLELCERTDQTASSLEQLRLVLIDEASMLDSKLLEIIFQSAHPFKTRLVFVGDPAQLPPIGESQSPVFEIQRAVRIKLNEVVRHHGPVLKLASCLRDGSLPCFSPPCLPIVENKQGLIGCLDQQSWLQRAKDALKSASLNDNPDAARILCYTNRSLEKLVPHARRAIHGEMADQLSVLPGEVLISRSAVMAPASKNGCDVGEEPDMLLGSNRELIVLDVTPEKCDLAEFGFVGESDWDVPVIETLVAKARAGEMEFSLRLIPEVGSGSRKQLDSTLKRLSDLAKAAEKSQSRLFWRKFFLLRDAFASLGPASVLTVHRSQGSTFDEVFVAEDVFWPKDLLLRRQLVYVAVSRASKGVWLVGSKKISSAQASWINKFNP